jgi:hypothetical protein
MPQKDFFLSGTVTRDDELSFSPDGTQHRAKSMKDALFWW